MNERVEEIRLACHGCIQRWGAEYGSGLPPHGGWTAHCEHAKAILAQAERELVQAKADYADASGECDELEQKLAQAERELYGTKQARGLREELLAARAEVERLKEFADGIRGVAKEQRFRAEEAESQARTFETRWMAAVNDLARVRAALRDLLSYTFETTVPPTIIDQARAALEGRGDKT